MSEFDRAYADFEASSARADVMRAEAQTLVAMRTHYRATAGDQFDNATLARLDFAKWLYQTGHIS